MREDIDNCAFEAEAAALRDELRERLTAQAGILVSTED
jgi:hypothetical protein